MPAFKRPAEISAADGTNVPVGMSGCLASACHGGKADRVLERDFSDTTWNGSGSCWVAADPHSAAYSLLTDNPSHPVKVTARQIMSRYAPGKAAVNDARCVACHTNPTLATTERMTDSYSRTLRTEGVGCEACHGSAGGWIGKHTTWLGERTEAYEKSGMVPLYDLGERAVACAGCHVGAPADKARGIPVRDMNHDMIAAGHPRLNFDFAEYMRRLPTHWQEKDRSKTPNVPLALNPAKVWLVGRVAHAEAACRLLADRAERSKADERTPWPELAEYNCASCHHDLRPGDGDGKHWRRDADSLGGRPPGLPPWQTIWPLTPAAGMDAPKRTELTALVELMEARRRPDPGRAERAATASAAQLRTRRRETVALPDEQAVSRLKGLLPPGAPAVAEWDSAAQVFFGSAALERSLHPSAKDVPIAFRHFLDAFRNENWGDAAEALKKVRENQ